MLWAVTCFFNAGGYRRPIENYVLFADDLESKGVNLLTVELAFGDEPFVLPTPKHRWVVRLRARDRLWQKERLLNHAISLLPKDCDKVMWTDADILFEPDIKGYMEWALNSHDIVQGFERAYRLEREQKKFSLVDSKGGALWTGYGAIRASQLECSWKQAAVGFVWAAKRQCFSNWSLYDKGILGSGDYFLLKCLHRYDPPRYSPAMYRSLLTWQYHTPRFKVGFAPGAICHLWHGDLKDRKYGVRQEILTKDAYDPEVDIRQNGAVYEWATDKPSLHHEVAEYFKNRREDGLTC